LPRIDIHGDVAILPAMFGMRLDRFSARRRVSRAGAGVILALWCLLSLTIGATQALCLEVGRECSPLATAPAGNCHDQAPDRENNPGCSSCVDVLVPEDASARRDRPDHDLRGPSTAQPHVAAHEALLAMDAVGATSTHPTVLSPLHPVLRTTVLRI